MQHEGINEFQVVHALITQSIKGSVVFAVLFM